jgi:hypothetical protein
LIKEAHWVRDQELDVDLDIVRRPQDRLMVNRSFMALGAAVFHTVVGEALLLAADEDEVNVLGTGDLLLWSQGFILPRHLSR